MRHERRTPTDESAARGEGMWLRIEGWAVGTVLVLDLIITLVEALK
jgi:hypothetical protein